LAGALLRREDKQIPDGEVRVGMRTRDLWGTEMKEAWSLPSTPFLYWLYPAPACLHAG